uniref:Extended-spectrum beta-lactamase n=1 Tax=Escherichia coli TaxID=562 RepID=A0A7I8HQJ2_ECOLX|nr:extended-spectrum beta-lactamase [Escherichia coli]
MRCFSAVEVQRTESVQSASSDQKISPCSLSSDCGKARQWDDVTGSAQRGRATVQRQRGDQQAACSRWRPGSRHRVRPTAGRRNVPSRPYRADVKHRHSGRSACYHFTSGNGANSAESDAGQSIGRQPTGAAGRHGRKAIPPVHRAFRLDCLPSWVVGEKTGGGGWLYSGVYL